MFIWVIQLGLITPQFVSKGHSTPHLLIHSHVHAFSTSSVVALFFLKLSIQSRGSSAKLTSVGSQQIFHPCLLHSSAISGLFMVVGFLYSAFPGNSVSTEEPLVRAVSCYDEIWSVLHLRFFSFPVKDDAVPCWKLMIF